MVEENVLLILGMENTFIGEAPIDNDNCQWIMASSGSSTIYFGKHTYDKPAFSIYIRGKDNRETKQRAQLAYDTLKNYCDANSAIIMLRLLDYIGRDAKMRHLYSFKIEYQLGDY